MSDTLQAQEPLFFGGQAVIEGVMIRGPRHYAVACRRQDGRLEVDSGPVRSLLQKKPSLRRIPVLRGLLAMVEMLSLGFRTLEWSANLQIEDIEGPRPQNTKPMMAGSILLGLGLGFVLFVLIPTGGADLLKPILGDHPFLLHLAEGLLRLGVLLGYISAIALIPDIRRVFAYHGAEHKVVNAFEASEPIEVDSVRPFSVIHPRCGTTFLFFVVVVSLFVFAFSPWGNLWVRLGYRLVLLPLVIGLSYELIRLSGRYGREGLFHTLILPGLMLQKLTTREPSDDMIQVAITAMETVREIELAGREEAQDESFIAEA